jgi:hypothetical protein
MEWDVPLSSSKKDVEPEERRVESSIKTQFGELLKPQKIKRGGLKILSASEKRPGPDIMPIEKKETSSVLSMPEPTEKRSGPTTENFITPTKSASEDSSMLPVISDNLPEPLADLSVNLNQEVLHSVNSLNDLGQELFSSMKGLRSNQPDTAVKLYDPERVHTAIACANQIVHVARAKLDLLKFAKEIK